eukprot:TRINITY_DN30526_c0_g1_i1.p1 TRINITY_DN30526_c0_g1~~TRINITY_DN30526_c0_g1_i1.p1  ORF type:complete len:1201 (-),score=212.79 TRINITY_DN30526_c0_g1_i1:213-3626(-)
MSPQPRMSSVSQVISGTAPGNFGSPPVPNPASRVRPMHTYGVSFDGNVCGTGLQATTAGRSLSPMPGRTLDPRHAGGAASVEAPHATALPVGRPSMSPSRASMDGTSVFPAAAAAAAAAVAAAAVAVATTNSSAAGQLSPPHSFGLNGACSGSKTVNAAAALGQLSPRGSLVPAAVRAGSPVSASPGIVVSSARSPPALVGPRRTDISPSRTPQRSLSPKCRSIGVSGGVVNTVSGDFVPAAAADVALRGGLRRISPQPVSFPGSPVAIDTSQMGDDSDGGLGNAGNRGFAATDSAPAAYPRSPPVSQAGPGRVVFGEAALTPTVSCATFMPGDEQDNLPRSMSEDDGEARPFLAASALDERAASVNVAMKPLGAALAAPSYPSMPPFEVVGSGGVFACDISVISASLPDSSDILEFCSQIDCGDVVRRNTDVASAEPVRLVAGGSVPDVFIRFLVTKKDCFAGPANSTPVEYEAALPLAEVFNRFAVNESGEIELGMVPTGLGANLADIHSYCSACVTSSAECWENIGARIRLSCFVSGRPAVFEPYDLTKTRFVVGTDASATGVTEGASEVAPSPWGTWRTGSSGHALSSSCSANSYGVANSETTACDRSTTAASTAILVSGDGLPIPPIMRYSDGDSCEGGKTQLVSSAFTLGDLDVIRRDLKHAGELERIRRELVVPGASESRHGGDGGILGAASSPPPLASVLPRERLPIGSKSSSSVSAAAAPRDRDAPVGGWGGGGPCCSSSLQDPNTRTPPCRHRPPGGSCGLEDDADSVAGGVVEAIERREAASGLAGRVGGSACAPPHGSVASIGYPSESAQVATPHAPRRTRVLTPWAKPVESRAPESVPVQSTTDGHVWQLPSAERPSSPLPTREHDRVEALLESPLPTAPGVTAFTSSWLSPSDVEASVASSTPSLQAGTLGSQGAPESGPASERAASPAAASSDTGHDFDSSSVGAAQREAQAREAAEVLHAGYTSAFVAQATQAQEQYDHVQRDQEQIEASAEHGAGNGQPVGDVYSRGLIAALRARDRRIAELEEALQQQTRQSSSVSAPRVRPAKSSHQLGAVWRPDESSSFDGFNGSFGGTSAFGSIDMMAGEAGRADSSADGAGGIASGHSAPQSGGSESEAACSSPK